MSVLKRTFLTKNITKQVAFTLFKRALSSQDVTSIYKSIDIPEMLLEERIFSKFDKFPNKIAMVCKIT